MDDVENENYPQSSAFIRKKQKKKLRATLKSFPFIYFTLFIFNQIIAMKDCENKTRFLSKCSLLSGEKNHGICV